MKFNISYPATGSQKTIEIQDDKKLQPFYDKRMSHEIDGTLLGPEYAGYVFKISGGNDKEGFPMKQGVLTANRVRLLMGAGHSCYRPRRSGERKRKSVRGCIVSSAIGVLNLVVVKKGEQEIPGVTDTIKPRRLGPKRASRIRKLFNRTKEDDVRKFVIRRTIERPGKKTYTKAAKIQRLVTPRRLLHKRQMKAEKRQRYERSREAAKEYNTLLDKMRKERMEERRKRSSRRESEREAAGKPQDKAKDKAKKDGAKAQAAQGKPAAAAPKAAAAAAKPAAAAAAAPAPKAKPAGKPAKPADKPAKPAPKK